jgi:hypothetical protein
MWLIRMIWNLICYQFFNFREGEFEKAHTDFFEAFKNYDESGSPRRTTCLKYLVLANMLMKSGINPFDSQVSFSNSVNLNFFLTSQTGHKGRLPRDLLAPDVPY